MKNGLRMIDSEDWRKLKRSCVNKTLPASVRNDKTQQTETNLNEKKVNHFEK